MELVNCTRLQARAFRQFDRAGDLDCIVAVRGSFLHRQGEAAGWNPEQMPFQWVDVHDGDPDAAPLVVQGDLTPEKVGTDVTFLGSSFAPETNLARWTCALEVGALSKRLHVSGPRTWSPIAASARRSGTDGAAWRLDEPVAADDVQIDWRLAYGGAMRGVPDAADEPDRDERNPVGCGRVGPPGPAPVPAPQILATHDLAPGDRPEPAGFGPLAPHWLGRRRHAGTYDDAWRERRHPLLPEDFDPRFWQCAPDDQIIEPFLASGAAYRLTNLHPKLPCAEGRLPDLDLAVLCTVAGREDWHVLALDGVQFDWRATDRILLTWRARFPLPEAARATLTLERVRLVDGAEASASLAGAAVA